jgi:hypothetical protein
MVSPIEISWIPRSLSRRTTLTTASGAIFPS